MDPSTTSTAPPYAFTMVSNEQKQMAELVNFCILCAILGLFGIVANIINIIVFVRQGFKDSINISLLGLAVADLACLITVVYHSISFNPYFTSLDLPFHAFDIIYLAASYPHVCFNRVTSLITMFITLERCLCITHPLKVKNLITPKRTKIIIASIYVITVIVFSPFYYVNRLQWNFDPLRNRTIYSLTTMPSREMVDSVTFTFHSVLMPTIALVFVMVCTAILIVKLNEKTKWRQSATKQAAANPEAVSLKEKRVVKMVTLISLIFLACLLPSTVIVFAMAFEPQLSFTGRFQNLFYILWSLVFVLESINSSVNIFVYFNMSSKFRLVFLQTFSCFVKKKM